MPLGRSAIPVFNRYTHASASALTFYIGVFTSTAPPAATPRCIFLTPSSSHAAQAASIAHPPPTRASRPPCRCLTRVLPDLSRDVQHALQVLDGLAVLVRQPARRRQTTLRAALLDLGGGDKRNAGSG